MSIETFYSQEFTISRPTISRSASGAALKTYATGAAFVGRLRPLSGKEIVASEREGVRITHRIYCNTVNDVRQTDRLTHGGKVFEVRFISDPMSMNHHQQIDAEEML